MLRLTALTGGVLAWTLAAGSAFGQELAPPPPLPPTQQTPATETTPGATNETTEQLQKAEKEDSGRGLEFFYLNAGAGFSAVGLTTFNSSDLGFGTTNAVGGVFDVGLGLRFLILSFGPRARFHKLSQFDLWQINGEVALHIPISKLDFEFGVHGGYSALGTLTQDVVGLNANVDDVRVRGFDAGLQLALDYYVSPHFSLGGHASGEVLVMTRPALAQSKDPVFGASGGSAGLAGILGVRAGLHF